MRKIEEIDKDIAETKAALANVKGGETEVYARIVGYYRSVNNWNKGKRDEFNHRKMFEIDDRKGCETLSLETVTRHILEYAAANADFRKDFEEFAQYDGEAIALLAKVA